jgi:signal transduction histidine kinase
MTNFTLFDLLINGVLFGIAVFLVFQLFNKIQMVASLNKDVERLSREVNELDHQARLIVKSDMELKFFQEEIEDKIKKLTILRNIISTTINTLDREELFAKLDEELINDLGFKKAAIFLYPSGDLTWNINFTEGELAIFKEIIDKKGKLLNALSVVSYEHLSTDNDTKDLLVKLDFNDFIFAPINVGTQVYAIFILAKCLLPSGISDAEKETTSIICMYLSQCLDNIKLFEALYHAGEELEGKIKEKTFQLSKSLNEITEMNKLKSEFISSVSHELRTPLTSIKGFSSLLVAEKFGVLPPEAKDRLIKIDTNVDKLVDMVNTLLDIARIESKRMEIKIAPADLIGLIKETVDLLMPLATQKQQKIELTLPEKLNVYMDKKLIERVFINIINNAIKFTPEQGTITVRVHAVNDTAQIAISDTGYGMEKEDIENLFKEFFRARTALNKGIKGTGLGLSLVKRIIDTHGQKIWVESALDRGTTFFFTLKIVQ